MAEVPVTINGVMYPKGRSATDAPIPCTIVGSAWITGLGVGGGPVPPQEPVDPGYSPPWARPPVDPGYSPPWAQVPPGGGGSQPPHPEHPIWGPPGFNPPGPGMPPGIGGGPIIPPNVPPGMQPPTPPNPGDPTTPVPPPAGSPGWPVSSIVPPPYIIVQYPGIGPVVVAPPVTPA